MPPFSPLYYLRVDKPGDLSNTLPGYFIGCRSEGVEMAVDTRRAKENASRRTRQYAENFFRVQRSRRAHIRRRSRSLMKYPGLIRRFLSNKIPSCWSFCLASALHQQAHSDLCNCCRALKPNNPGAIWYLIFRQSPNGKNQLVF